MANYVKFKTNVSEIIKFHFNTPKEFESKFGKVFSYGVEWKGQDAYLSATPTLNDKLQALGGLKDRTLEVEKAEGENNRLYWIIKENGTEITPEPQNTSYTTPTPKTQENATGEATGDVRLKLHQLNSNQQKIVTEIQKIKEEQKAIRTLLVDLKGEEAVELHESTTGETPEEKKEDSVKIEDIPII